MKKLLLILLCLPFIGFGQCISGDCENGQGTYTYASGIKYVGEFKDDKFNGQGTKTWADGTEFNKKGKVKYTGLWGNGVITTKKTKRVEETYSRDTYN